MRPIFSGPSTSMEGILLRLSSSIDKLEKRFVDTDSESLFELEWKKVSLVVDRLCLLIFFLAMTIASLSILTSRPRDEVHSPMINSTKDAPCVAKESD